ncbi:hypothetical protein RHSIM_Rhsim02G0206100 [Rhododendron simsii]|uniref:Uncharacterized protein n=1 Tax=Rhododendron simsii TaxID=118357 RepID=A0A834HE29_RHOSS|nr:hypothetical protein RHSIM_Rhsim02G0206100 [Rhododendron simsii]
MSAGDCGNGGSSGGCKCGCCCVHNGAKMEDIQPHPVMEQLPGVEKAKKFERTMRGMQGALIVASCFQMLFSLLGVWRNVVSYPSFYGSSHDFYWTWAILSRFSNGRPTFQAGEAFAMMAASLVASPESTGTFLATARYGSATPVPASVLSRGVGWLFNDIVTVIFTSHATLAVLVAVTLDCTLAREDDEGGKDSGSHWWEKFMFYDRDVKTKFDEYWKNCSLALAVAAILDPRHFTMVNGHAIFSPLDSRVVVAVVGLNPGIESAFSAGDRMLDQCRNSLRPDTPQALVCAQDWIRNDSEG